MYLRCLLASWQHALGGSKMQVEGYMGSVVVIQAKDAYALNHGKRMNRVEGICDVFLNNKWHKYMKSNMPICEGKIETKNNCQQLSE